MTRPPLGERTPLLFWNDDHISKQMLKAHLSFDNDLASRKKTTIVASVDFILSTLKLPLGAKILDIGCGPGLYTEEFARRGFKVTGIDYSQRSLQYAKESAMKQGLPITYLFQDYLTIDFVAEFDLITLIYFDYGALTKTERETLNPKLTRALKQNGHFVFDAYSTQHFQKLQESREATQHPQGGFWSEKKYQLQKDIFLYPEAKTDLTRYIVTKEDEAKTYHIWNTSFDLQDIEKNFSPHGLSLEKSFSDLMGNREIKSTLALFLKKSHSN